MMVHKIELPSSLGSTHWRFICSDLHIESPNFDHALFRADMEAAQQVGARVLINGDVFDAISRNDRRWTIATSKKEIRDRADYCRAAIDLATEVLSDYVDVIDIIGHGNHESTWVRVLGVDPIAELITSLNRHREKLGITESIRHGSTSGFIRTILKLDQRHAKDRVFLNHTLLYMHGYGSASNVGKGVSDMTRLAANWDYDAVTYGHKHNRLFVDDVVVFLNSRCYIQRKQRKAIQTGSYVDSWRRTKDEAPHEYNYAEDFAHPPKPLGGVFLALTPTLIGKGKNRHCVIDQQVCTKPTIKT